MNSFSSVPSEDQTLIFDTVQCHILRNIPEPTKERVERTLLKFASLCSSREGGWKRQAVHESDSLLHAALVAAGEMLSSLHSAYRQDRDRYVSDLCEVCTSSWNPPTADADGYKVVRKDWRILLASLRHQLRDFKGLPEGHNENESRRAFFRALRGTVKRAGLLWTQQRNSEGSSIHLPNFIKAEQSYRAIPMSTGERKAYSSPSVQAKMTISIDLLSRFALAWPSADWEGIGTDIEDDFDSQKVLPAKAMVSGWWSAVELAKRNLPALEKESMFLT